MTNSINDQFEKDSAVILKYLGTPNQSLKSQVKGIIEKNLDTEKHIQRMLSYSGIIVSYSSDGETSDDAAKYILQLALDYGFDPTKFLQLLVYTSHSSVIDLNSKLDFIRLAVNKGAKLESLDFTARYYGVAIEALRLLIELDKESTLQIRTIPTTSIL